MNGVNFGLVETAVAKHGCLQKKSAVNFGRTSHFYHLQITNFVLLFSK